MNGTAGSVAEESGRSLCGASYPYSSNDGFKLVRQVHMIQRKHKSSVDTEEDWAQTYAQQFS